MWKKAALICTFLCIALVITACGKTSPTAPSGADTETQVKPASAGKTSDGPASRRKSDDHPEPPGNLPPGP
jgi:hypothetical protein